MGGDVPGGSYREERGPRQVIDRDAPYTQFRSSDERAPFGAFSLLAGSEEGPLTEPKAVDRVWPREVGFIRFGELCRFNRSSRRQEADRAVGSVDHGWGRY